MDLYRKGEQQHKKIQHAVNSTPPPLGSISNVGGSDAERICVGCKRIAGRRPETFKKNVDSIWENSLALQLNLPAAPTSV